MFEVGDVVRLKSGSVRMTVEHTKEYNEDTKKIRVECVYFDGPNVVRSSFRDITLEHVPVQTK